ncbi:MAG: amidohydrolase family protein [Nitrososphaerales archaeon]
MKDSIIDAYTHNIPPNFLKKIEYHKNPSTREAAETAKRIRDRIPSMVSASVRLEEMDKAGIDRQVVANFEGTDPNGFEFAEDERLSLTRIINEDMAEMCRQSRGRIYGLASVPLRSLKNGGIEEMRRAINELGLKGFEVISHAQGEPLDHFPEFWQEVSRLSVPVYIHPVDPRNSESRPYEDEYDLTHVFGWPFESTLAVARLVLSGTMSRHANLNVLVHHLGAMIPFFEGRINESYREKISLLKPDQKFDEVREKNEKPIDHFKRFYIDTAIGGSSSAIKCGSEVFGIHKVIFATDYPFGPDNGRGRLGTYPGAVRKAGFPQEALEQIFNENASKMLKI